MYLNAFPKPRTVSELKVALEKIWNDLRRSNERSCPKFEKVMGHFENLLHKTNSVCWSTRLNVDLHRSTL